MEGVIDYHRLCFEKILMRDRVDTVNPEPLFQFIIFLIGLVPDVVDKIIIADVYVYGKKYIMHNPKNRKKILDKLQNLSCFSIFQNLENIISDNSSGRMSYRQLMMKMYDRRYDNCKVYIDNGTIRPALHNSKIYLAGVMKVEGKFQVGDIVKIVNEKGEELFKAMMFMPSDKIDTYKGMHSHDVMMYEGLINTFVSKASYRILTNKAILNAPWYKKRKYKYYHRKT